MINVVRRRVVVSLPDGGRLLVGNEDAEFKRRRIAVLLAWLASIAMAVAALLALHVATGPSSHQSPPQKGLPAEHSSELGAGLAAAFSSSVGASDREYWPVRNGSALLTSGGGIHGSFTASGARLRVGAGALDVSLVRVGRDGLGQRVRVAAPQSARGQVLYRHGSIGEFFRNGPYGLEQGFTLRAPPRGGAGSLTLTLAVRGSLIPTQAGRGVAFRTRAGATALSYGQLSAVDATGRPLATRLRVRNGAVQLQVDDQAAVYPLRIDPFFHQGPKLTGAGESGKGLFGETVALSADGNTALIGAPSDSNGAGAAWAFTRSGSTWEQQGPKLTGGEEVGKGHFGNEVALSADGNTAMVGGGSDNGEVGAAWAFTRSGSTWEQQGPKLTGGEEVGKGHFGFRVALSSDGNTALVGGPLDNGKVGATWAFTRSGSTWEQQGPKLTGASEIGGGEFGLSVALSADGNTAMVGGGSDNGEVGAAWPFTRSGSTWEQQGAKLTGGGEVGKGHFGFRVALSDDGNTALVGGGSDNSEVGAAWAFTRSGSTWTQQGSKLTASGEVGKGHFGFSLALSADGNIALLGGVDDHSEVGAAWTFKRSGSAWTQESELTGSGEVGAGLFGQSVALSEDGTTALVGGGGDSGEVGAAWAFLFGPAPPHVNSISPSSGTTVGGTKVTIKGASFVAGATVTIGNAATSVNVLSETELTATTTATAAGSDEVVVTDANGTSTGGPSYTYVAPPPPTVTSVTPTSGPAAGGTKVTIKGTGFLAGATVTIGNAATSVVVASATKITAVTSATAAGSDPVVVSDANGTSTGGPSYTYVVPPPPTVTSISPTSGPAAGGTKVTINGTGFAAGATVTIGNAATSVVVASATKLTAVTSATAAGSHAVVVSDANGTSTGGPSYTYVAPPPPTVTSVTPTSGPAAGGTKVTIKGTGFLAGATVTIGNAATSVVVASATKITAVTSATAAGSDPVVVSDANGTSTGGPSYTYVAGQPMVTSVTPGSGSTAGGTSVTINGSNLTAGPNPTVAFGSTNAPNITSATPTTVVVVSPPAAAGTVDVRVTTSGGTSPISVNDRFTYVTPPPPPNVTSITPNSGSTEGNTGVTIKGSGFLAGATVTIGNAATSVNVVSATELTATTTASPAGSDEVVVSDANGTSTGGPSFTYVAPPPVVTSVTPGSGSTAGGTKVTIKGSGFLAGATVTIGNAATSVNVVSATELTATTTASPAGSDEVVVTDANGTSTGGPSFTYVAPPPTVTSITPNSGSTEGGTSVTIKGSGFVSGATVTIGSQASEVLVLSETELIATTTASPAGSDEVVVSDANGTSTGGPSFTYVAPPPVVTSVTPGSGSTAGGTKVTIKGSGFLAGATVTIGNAATSVNVVSATELTATTTASPAGSDEVVVSDANGTSTGGPSFTYVAPPPTVTSITPNSGSTEGGTSVTIKGSGFLLSTTVTIGSQASEVLVLSETELTATTTASPAGSDEVVVSDANGTSTGGPSFTYVAPPPTVTSITPNSGSTEGGTSVTIKGSGFVSGATVTVGSEASEVLVLSETELIATTTASPAGSDEVVVSDANGTSTGGPSFTYVAPPPVVTSVTPGSGSTAGGTKVTIKGSGFLAGATVTIGNAATSVNVVSATELTATTTASPAGSDEVVVSDANGTSTGGPSFTYVAPPPTVTSITPNSGSTEGGTSVTIKGSGFLLSTTVTIGSQASEVLVLSETELTATTTASPAGSDEVVVSDANGTSTGGPSFTYVAPPPTVTSITPNSGSTEGGTSVTIKGSGFVSGATVTIGSEASEVLVLSETELIATTTASPAGSDEVVVTDANGTSTGGPSYTYE